MSRTVCIGLAFLVLSIGQACAQKSLVGVAPPRGTSDNASWSAVADTAHTLLVSELAKADNLRPTKITAARWLEMSRAASVKRGGAGRRGGHSGDVNSWAPIDPTTEARIGKRAGFRFLFS